VPGGVECLGEIKRDKSDIRFRCQERGGLLEDRDEGSHGRGSWPERVRSVRRLSISG